MIEEVKEDVLPTCEIRLAGQVQRPGPISRSGAGHAMFDSAPQGGNVDL